MKKSVVKPLSLQKIKTISIKTRKHKAKIADFATFPKKGSSILPFIESLPHILKAQDLIRFIDATVTAHHNRRVVLLAMGDSVIKVGLSPLVIELIKRRLITGIAMQGAGVIHDTEVALIGETSEDVAVSIQDGTFGMAEETGSFLNKAIKEGFRDSLGIGEAVGRALNRLKSPFKKYSIAAAAYEAGVPLTVHVAVGTDTIHMHPEADGKAIGEGSHIDFRKFASQVSDLEGGVIINIGSAVILPEVFLKALSVTRNLGYHVQNFTAANFDMIQHYRPMENVVKRPTQGGGQGFTFTGHHEIMFPLFVHALLEKLEPRLRPLGFGEVRPTQKFKARFASEARRATSRRSRRHIFATKHRRIRPDESAKFFGGHPRPRPGSSRQRRGSPKAAA